MLTSLAEVIRSQKTDPIVYPSLEPPEKRREVLIPETTEKGAGKEKKEPDPQAPKPLRKPDST